MQNAEHKAKIMAETSQLLISMIQKRLTSRLNALAALQASPLDSIPDEIKKMREIESCSIRAVMQEQADLIEIINILFPQIPQETNKTKNAKN